MAMTRVANRAAVLAALALAGALSGCAHRRSRIADIEPERERSVVLADGVSVRATLWDRMLVDRAADDDESGVDELGRARKRERLDRLQTRYGDGVVFTVLLELAHRNGSDDPLSDPSTWWFNLQRGGQTVAAKRVEVLAVDRFPTGATRAGGVPSVHLRIALLVAFDATAPDDGPVVLRLGSRAKDRRRFALGPIFARHGSMLRWAPERG
jgi:hypothetical protein